MTAFIVQTEEPDPEPGFQQSMLDMVYEIVTRVTQKEAGYPGALRLPPETERLVTAGVFIGHILRELQTESCPSKRQVLAICKLAMVSLIHEDDLVDLFEVRGLLLKLLDDIDQQSPVAPYVRRHLHNAMKGPT